MPWSFRDCVNQPGGHQLLGRVVAGLPIHSPLCKLGRGQGHQLNLLPMALMLELHPDDQGRFGQPRRLLGFLEGQSGDESRLPRPASLGWSNSTNSSPSMITLRRPTIPRLVLSGSRSGPATRAADVTAAAIGSVQYPDPRAQPQTARGQPVPALVH